MEVSRLTSVEKKRNIHLIKINFVFFVVIGKVKVNESTIITSNIPSTNGVIHAIDTLL